MLEWEPCPSRGWAPRPPVEQPRRTGRKGCDSQRSCGVNMLQSLFGLQLPLTHNPFNKVKGIFSQRTVSARLYYCVVMFLHASVYAYVYATQFPDFVDRFKHNKEEEDSDNDKLLLFVSLRLCFILDYEILVLIGSSNLLSFFFA